MDAAVMKIIGSVFSVIILAVILARSEAFNNIIKTAGGTTTEFMKTAMTA